MLLTSVVKFVVDVDVFANTNSYIIFVFLSFFAPKATRYILKNLIVNLGQCESLVVRRIKDIWYFFLSDKIRFYSGKKLRHSYVIRHSPFIRHSYYVDNYIRDLVLSVSFCLHWKFLERKFLFPGIRYYVILGFKPSYLIFLFLFFRKRMNR